MKTFEDFLEEYKGQVMRFWRLKQIWTPYEEQQAFDDIYENDEAYWGYITDAYELPDGDIMLEIKEELNSDSADFYKLSEFDLAWFKSDQDE